MKILQSSVIRAIVALVVGILIIKYREETVQWLTVVIGGLFFISGIISCSITRRSMGSIVGFGSIVLGIILALMPTTFVTGLQYALAAVLVLGAVNQFVNLGQACRYCHVGWFFWLLPTVVLLIAILMIWRPFETATAPLFIIGWCMLLYGAAELLNGIKIFKAHRIRQQAEEAVKKEELPPPSDVIVDAEAEEYQSTYSISSDSSASSISDSSINTISSSSPSNSSS